MRSMNYLTGFDYLGRSSQSGDDGEDVYEYVSHETGKHVYLNAQGKAYDFLGVTVSGDNMFMAR